MIYMSFFIGLILICKGGDWFVDAASKLSEILGIPKYVIGATIVSFATTMPEIIVSVAAALDGHSAMAIGNAVGSVSANTGIILALSLFFLPVAIKREEYLFKNSLYIGTLLLLLISFKDRIFDRADCLLLLLAGILFLVENVKNAVCKKELSNSKRKKEDVILHKKIQAGKNGEKKVKNKRSKWKEKQSSIWETFFWFCIGAVCIVAGSELLVNSAYQRRYYLGNDCCNGNIFAGTCNNSYSNPKKRVFFVCRKYYRCKYDRFRFYFTNLYIT